MIGIHEVGASVPEFSSGSEQELASLREQFGREHCVRLGGFLDPQLFERIVCGVEEASFYERSHGRIGLEGCMEANSTLATLLLAANDPRLFGVIREITGCGPIGCFDGRVYRMAPASDHHDSWHSDVADSRMIAMSVNLTRRPYEGGVLQIRETDSEQILHEESAPDPGDAIIFRLDESLRHRVTAVEGEVPRTAFAGWFKSRPSFAEVLRGTGWSA
jgi:2OG-Fe(II) oxygenase superfamily